MAFEDIKRRVRQYLNPAIKGKFTEAMLEAIAAGDQANAELILAVKDQLAIATASGTFLEKLLAGLGVTKPPGVGISDDLFREIGIKQTNSKLVTNIFLDVLEIFYGEEAIRANVLSGRPEGYVFEDGMTISFLVDSNPQPLVVTFTPDDFTNIANASAVEVANLISRTSFNSGYTLTATTFRDSDTGQIFVQLFSGTKGPRSAITIVGGAAQNILRFPELKSATPNIGTQFTTSFAGPYVRYTWTAGPSPELAFVNPGDYANIFGAGYLEFNKGVFPVVNVQDGPVGSAYFEIINPIFVPQGPVTMTQVPGASGDGKVVVTAVISPIPTGASRTSNLVTIQTAANHGFMAGQRVTVTGVDNTSFNGTYIITATPTLSTFQYSQVGVDSASGGGQASVEYLITVTGAVRSGGTTTITTTSPHNLTVGQSVQIEDVRDSSFDGTFPITVIGASTFQYTQDESNDILFFNPSKQTIQKLPRYASVYEASPYEVVVFMPATTKIVKRTLIGSWHVHNSALDTDFLSAYSFDTTTGFPVTKTGTQLISPISAGELRTVIFGGNTSQFPDQEGFVVFDWGTSNQEGPVRYLGRPSSGSLLMDPAYKFRKSHAPGADLRLCKDRKPYKPKIDGTDYATYVTGTVVGRVEAQKLIEKLKAAGIFLSVIIVYPKGPGLHNVEGYVYAPDFS